VRAAARIEAAPATSPNLSSRKACASATPAYLATASAAFSGVAAAACPAHAAPVIAPGDGILSVEGPVSAIDLVDRTVTVVGTCINIPATMLIDTSFDGVGDITLDQLVTGGATSPIGGTMIIDADVTTDLAGNVVYTATNPYFDFGENVVVGPLISVDPLTSSSEQFATYLESELALWGKFIRETGIKMD
jgi:hypothetical protein